MKIFKLTLFLSIVGAIIALTLYFTNALTSPIIEKNNAIKTEETLSKMVGKMDGFEIKPVDSDVLTNIYEIKQDGKITSSVLEVKTFGFQSEIQLLVLIRDNKYQGFEVVQQAETAGYGTQIVDNEDYRSQFKNKSINEEIDTISGSTVTTSKVNDAIKEAIALYQKNQ